MTQFYENVLNRAPDQAGVNYWVNVLDKGQAPLANDAKLKCLAVPAKNY